MEHKHLRNLFLSIVLSSSLMGLVVYLVRSRRSVNLATLLGTVQDPAFNRLVAVQSWFFLVILLGGHIILYGLVLTLYGRYAESLQGFTSPLRWIDFVLLGNGFLLLTYLYGGIYDLSTLVLVGTVVGLVGISGWSMDKVNDPSNTHPDGSAITKWYPLLSPVIAVIPLFYVLTFSLLGNLEKGLLYDGTIPWVVSIMVFWFVFVFYWTYLYHHGRLGLPTERSFLTYEVGYFAGAVISRALVVLFLVTGGVV